MAFSSNVSQQMKRYYEENKLQQPGVDQLLSVKTSIGNVIASDLHQGSKLVAYGSSLSGFGTKDSDVDCCLWFPNDVVALPWNARDQKRGCKILNEICKHLNGMGSSGPVKSDNLYLKVKEHPVAVMQCISTRHQKSIDVQVDMTPAIVSTFLQRKYKECDPNVARLGVIVKQWRSKQNIWLTSAACVLMVIHYMQAKEYLPVFFLKSPFSWDDFPKSCGSLNVQQLEEMMISGSFNGLQDIFEAAGASYTMPPLDELVKGFFQYYADFTFETKLIRVSTGIAEYREENSKQPIFVEDPIYRSNIAESTQESDFRKLGNQLRRARDILQRPENWQAIMDMAGSSGRVANQAEASQIQVFVLKVDGKTITVDISKKDLVQTLKKKIETRIGLASCQQSLNYGGSPLEDQRTLESYGIGNLATIQMVGRLRGGS